MMIFLQRDGSYAWHEAGKAAQGNLQQLLVALNLSESHQLILPPAVVVTTELTLPKVKRSRLRQAIAFALEEDITDDINELHFAYQAIDDQHYQVAYLYRDVLRNALLPLQQAGVTLDFVGSPEFCLPYQEKQGSLLGIDDLLMVRINKHRGLCLPVASFNQLYLRLGLPKQLKAYSCPTDLLERNDGIFLQREPGGLLEVVQACDGVNLLQGEFKVKAIKSTETKWWRNAAIVAGIFIVLTFVKQGVQYYQLDYANGVLKQEVTQAYKAIFPNATAVVAPRVRVQRLLDQLGTQKHDGVLALLQQSGFLVSDNFKLTQVDYQQETLWLHFTTTKPKQIYSAILRLHNEKIRAELVNHKMAQQKMIGVLRLAEGLR